MPAPKIGVVGLGNMGGGIARNLAKSKFPLAVWDSSKKAVKAFDKVKNAAPMPPGEMAACCDVIIFVVPGSSEIDEVLKGRTGVLANAKKGLALYDFTTSDPAYTKKLSSRAAKKGVAYLDAGMSGGATGAAAGTLTLMLGGDKK
ncbi:MAG: NAD(P)-dependent oxidoreductase, partial [Nitrospinaceae bacterium]|nr:NAD(P)-dependent oxidoreductase [Nitrospinaceae bacterium]